MEFSTETLDVIQELIMELEGLEGEIESYIEDGNQGDLQRIGHIISNVETHLQRYNDEVHNPIDNALK